MLSRATSKPSRIRPLRPLRPPNRSKPRPFTQNTHRLHLKRPQLPYLAQPSHTTQSNRWISTAGRSRFVRQSIETAYYTVLFGTLGFLAITAWSGVEIELAERKNPTPDEWRFYTRQSLRQAREARDRKGFIDWATVGGHMKECLRRLEDAEKEGKGLGEAGGEEILIPDVGKAGPDVTSKSYEWRTGYVEAVMGCALSSEHLEGKVFDRTRNWVFPKEMMVGPNNADPRPTPSFMSGGVAPREEDCEPAFAPPETYYMRILTGKGFTTTQKLDAVEGYANWLEMKGLQDSAKEMYLWGVDIAKAASPEEVVGGGNVLNENGHASANVLRATTSLATHHARNGDISSALPIFLSVLRARRTAPISSSPPLIDNPPAPPDSHFFFHPLSFMKDLFTGQRWAPPPPSGDDAYTKYNQAPTCDESELMLYIGEILFASSVSNSEEGLGWTRQAVRIAEANVPESESAAPGGLVPDERAPQSAEVNKCKQCLRTGMGNWEAMLKTLTTQRAVESVREGGWRGWFRLGSPEVKEGQSLESMVAELKKVEVRKEELAQQAARERMVPIPKRWVLG